MTPENVPVARAVKRFRLVKNTSVGNQNGGASRDVRKLERKPRALIRDASSADIRAVWQCGADVICVRQRSRGRRHSERCHAVGRVGTGVGERIRERSTGTRIRFPCCRSRRGRSGYGQRIVEWAGLVIGPITVTRLDNRCPDLIRDKRNVLRLPRTGEAFREGERRNRQRGSDVGSMRSPLRVM